MLLTHAHGSTSKSLKHYNENLNFNCVEDLILSRDLTIIVHASEEQPSSQELNLEVVLGSNPNSKNN